jgi:hypothetical protein
LADQASRNETCDGNEHVSNERVPRQSYVNLTFFGEVDEHLLNRKPKFPSCMLFLLKKIKRQRKEKGYLLDHRVRKENMEQAASVVCGILGGVILHKLVVRTQIPIVMKGAQVISFFACHLQEIPQSFALSFFLTCMFLLLDEI